MHTCPMFDGPVPHVGGPILPPGAPTVLIEFLPAATVTNMLTCVGPPDTIVKGSTGVFINGLPAARIGDLTAHGGVIVMGSPNVIIGRLARPRRVRRAWAGGAIGGLMILPWGRVDTGKMSADDLGRAQIDRRKLLS